MRVSAVFEVCFCSAIPPLLRNSVDYLVGVTFSPTRLRRHDTDAILSADHVVRGVSRGASARVCGDVRRTVCGL